MTNNNDRLTKQHQLARLMEAQASDYSRKLAYREQRNYPKLAIADVVVMFFVGILVTVLFAFIVGAL